MAPSARLPEQLLAQARRGDDAALGRLLELYRNYLRFMARSLIGGALQAKLDPSDVVQETYLKAHADFDRFLGQTEPELVAWLRTILIHRLADMARHHQAQGRDLRREESLEEKLDRSSLELQGALAAWTPSPTAQAMKREHAVLLAEALERLPADYRAVFVLRNLEHVPLEEVANRMGRSANAVSQLWRRALLALRRELEEIS
jgi:RNA polymerase sigma-70 factor (ECF subfamily)